MYEPITVVKVREARTVTIPAGGWMLLCGPAEPLSKHIEQRTKLVNAGTVNDEMSELIIGRLQNTHSILRFVTKKESEAQAVNAKAHDASIAKNIEDARKREEKMANDAANKAQKEHEERVAKINRENDSVRTRGGSVKDPNA